MEVFGDLYALVDIVEGKGQEERLNLEVGGINVYTVGIALI